MKIVMCSSEVVPFAKTGGLADVVGALPLVLEELSQEVIILMPFYKKAAHAKGKIKKLFPGVLSTTLGNNIKVYFIDNEKYFNRDGLYGDQNGDYPDNLERYSFFCKECLKLLKKIKFKPDIIHINDWQTCCIPIYLNTEMAKDPFYKDTKTLLTIHNLAYQGLFPANKFSKLGLDDSVFSIDKLEFYGQVNLLKGGIVFSDCLNTVSSTYAKEIQTKEFGCGLEGLLSQRKDSLFGILNGLDYSIWDPAKDEAIFKHYDSDSLDDKYKNKIQLRKTVKLDGKDGIPLFGMVSRLSEQKGLDIIAQALDEICKLDLQVVILGTGDVKYHKLLQEKSKKFSRNLRLHAKFDNVLAHNIYAGSDVFLMPSRYEPCGLGQMISLKYATIPLVCKTGGLADTITSANGFLLEDYTPSALFSAVKDAIELYQDKKKWRAKMKRASKANFSWRVSGKEYVKLYKKLLKK